MAPRIRSFPPLADRRSVVLVLGTMPGPEALRKREYYGFSGNHFWRIMADLFDGGRPLDYLERIALVKRHRIALWDVLASCERVGAADSAIRAERPTDIARLLARHPGIGMIFLNGGTCERLYRKYHGDRIPLPRLRLPSTSPAHASIPYSRKLEAWSAVARYLETVHA